MSEYNNLTGQQIKEAAVKSNTSWVDHHRCSLCGEMVGYRISYDGMLHFAPGCGCSWSPLEPRSWDSVADWIRMQSSDEVKAKIARSFGVEIALRPNEGEAG